MLRQSGHEFLERVSNFHPPYVVEHARKDRNAPAQHSAVLPSTCMNPLGNVHVSWLTPKSSRTHNGKEKRLRVSSETVGHALKYLGLYSRRLGSAGRGLVLDEATKSQAHSLGQAYEVSVDEPVCAHCHQLQALQPQGVV